MGHVWWCMPVIPVTWEAEAGELLEPGRWKLQCAKIVPLHSRLDDRARLHLKKPKAKQKKKQNDNYNNEKKKKNEYETSVTLFVSIPGGNCLKAFCF